MTRRFTHLFFLAVFGLAPVRPVELRAEPPRRVVSLNVCTDQLAMLIAADGQLHSVSRLSADPRTAALAHLAENYVLNHGQTEEIFLMQPDLVLGGTFSTRNTVELLRRLGFRVEEFEPETSFGDVRANLLRMGELLGREARAEELVAELDAGLAELKRNAPPESIVALYEVNSHTSGIGTLANAVVRAAGLVNLAEKLGYSGSVRLPLESLIMAEPDLLAGGDIRHDAPSLADQNFIHPAYLALAGKTKSVYLPSGHMVCGAPFTLISARILQEAAR